MTAAKVVRVRVRASPNANPNPNPNPKPNPDLGVLGEGGTPLGLLREVELALVDLLGAWGREGERGGDKGEIWARYRRDILAPSRRR